MATAEAALDGYQTFFDPETCISRGNYLVLAWPRPQWNTYRSDIGLCPVSKVQKEEVLESHSLYYGLYFLYSTSLAMLMPSRLAEIHGTGPEKLVFIMGYEFSLILLCEPLAYDPSD